MTLAFGIGRHLEKYSRSEVEVHREYALQCGRNGYDELASAYMAMRARCQSEGCRPCSSDEFRRLVRSRNSSFRGQPVLSRDWTPAHEYATNAIDLSHEHDALTHFRNPRRSWTDLLQ